MIRSLFGSGTITSSLRGGLEEASATHRAIAQRVSSALTASTSTDFSNAFEAQQSKKQLSEVDLEREMASLADTQIRYEADAKLLQAAYSRLRTAMRERG